MYFHNIMVKMNNLIRFVVMLINVISCVKGLVSFK